MEKTSLPTKQMIGPLMLVASCLALSMARSSAATTYFADDFEQGLGKWTVGGDTWQVTDLFSRSGGRCASESPLGSYARHANSVMAMKLQQRVNLTNSVIPILSFWHRVGVNAGDFAYVEISQDYGFTWEELTSFTNTHRSTWCREQVVLSEYKSATILIRFRLRDDGGRTVYGDTVAAGWDIDDVQIHELDPETLLFPLSDDFENGTDNWVFGGWQPTQSYSRSGTHSLTDSHNSSYPRAACSDLILAHPIDLSASVSPVLRFWHRIGVNAGDYGYVEVSQDFGFTWEELASFTNVNRSTWCREQFDLSAYKHSLILIRFRLRDDGGRTVYGDTVAAGWDIDDIEIRELDSETLPFPLFDDFESGTNNWAFGGWQPTQSYSRSQTHSMTDSNNVSYPKAACSNLILAHPIDLSASVWPVLSFWHRIGVNSGDYGCVEVSQDGGFSWHAIDPRRPEESTFTNVSYANWVFELMDLSAYQSSQILIRFRLRDDGGRTVYGDTVAAGWDIDDVAIRDLIPPELQVEMTGLTAIDCPTIKATVVVADVGGNPITGLPASAFTVSEDGEPQAATVIESSSQTVCASLVLDFSGSMGPATLDLQWAAEQFVNLMRPGDSGEIIKFADGIEVTQTYTESVADLNEAIWLPQTVGLTQTAFYDAVHQAILDTAAQEGADSKAVVAMTDGWDTMSTRSATEVIELAKRMGVRIYTIGLAHQVVDAPVDEDVLRAMAALTGGVYYYTPTSDELEAIYRAIAGTLRNQYIVTYETAACGSDASRDLEHEVMITVEAPAGFGLDTARFQCPAECRP